MANPECPQYLLVSRAFRGKRSAERVISQFAGEMHASEKYPLSTFMASDIRGVTGDAARSDREVMSGRSYGAIAVVDQGRGILETVYVRLGSRPKDVFTRMRQVAAANIP